MTEYIERDAVYEMLENAQMISDGEYCGYCTEDVTISSIPAADVVRVRHGRWGTHSDRPDSLICSVCNYGFDMWKHDPHNYCPNCGAKMDGELNE